MIPINTTLDTLSEAYIILDDLGLTSFLTGGTIEIEPGTLVRELLRKKKLNAFIMTFTDLDAKAVGALSIAEAIDLITRFFVSTASELSLLAQVMTPPQNSPEKA